MPLPDLVPLLGGYSDPSDQAKAAAAAAVLRKQASAGYLGLASGFPGLQAAGQAVTHDASQGQQELMRIPGQRLTNALEAEKVRGAKDTWDAEHSPQYAAAHQAYLGSINPAMARAAEGVTNPRTLQAIEGLATKKYGFDQTAAWHKAMAPGAGGPGDTGGLSREALDRAAHGYHQTGKLPTIAQGRAGAPTKLAILNREAELYKGGQGLGAGQADYKTNTAALTKLRGMRAAVNAFEETAGKNLDQMLSTMAGLVDTGVPWANKPLRSLQGRLLGDPRYTDFQTARRVAINEFAKVATNPNLTGVLTDESRREIEALADEGATPAQMHALVRRARIDMHNRIAALDAEEQRIIQAQATPQPTPQPPAAGPAAPAGNPADPLGLGLK
jgi:hypothetical protein